MRVVHKTLLYTPEDCENVSAEPAAFILLSRLVYPSARPSLSCTRLLHAVCKRSAGAGREFTERLMRKEHGNSFLKERSLLHELTALHSSLGEEKIAEIEMDKEQRERCAEILQAALLPSGDAGNEARLPGPYALDLNCSVCLVGLFISYPSSMQLQTITVASLLCSGSD